ncbi:excisionase family DNA binding protein [Microbacterium testaceum]|uniref:helix-turn-helix transcriptional regulator n=1 Tax=Microbacterium TaxID=33882 RepID=UPI002783093E|nr:MULTISPECIES: helix-turn-helix domain-containing protein [Microbacterium]MDQ1111093.1 excisionase family DNA binding protein [Microbacterium testaceum]MDR6098365.1 excisionase family DNA binding protein [Microbacterium sp. SORGH_AS_0454]
MSAAPAPEILTIQQVAEVTGLAVKTLRNMRSKGEGPDMWLLRGRVRCYRSDLDAWVREQAGIDKVTPLKRTA